MLYGRKARLAISSLGLVLLSCCTWVWACNVPVFRFALDHWQPDTYQAIVLHHGPIPPASRSALESLTKAAKAQQINFHIKQLDVTENTELPSKLRSFDVSTSPHLLLHYPADLDIEQPIVSAQLDSLNLSELIDSPLRRELIKRLQDGQSAVWLLLASGQSESDETARATLAAELQRLQSTLELPKLTDDPEDAIRGGPALRVEFSVIEIARDDEREWALRNMLLGSEPDLRELAEPMVFPVFGRGRALWPLVGAGINPENLRESATFVTGACSCQVKEQNPGFDLLLNASWPDLLPWTSGQPTSHNQALEGSTAETIPIPTGSNMSHELLAMGIGSATTGDSAPPVTTQAAQSGSTTLIVVALVAVAVVGLIAFFLTKAKRAPA